MNAKVILPLVVLAAFFLRKGIQYAVLGSYLPGLIILCFLAPIIVSYVSQKRNFVLWTKILAYAIISWGALRVMFAVVNRTVKPLKEYHLHVQFGMGGLIISLLMISVAVYLLIQLKTKKTAGPD